MLSSTVRALRQRISPVSAALWLFVLAVVYVFTDNIGFVLAFSAAYLVAEAMDVLRTVPGVDERWSKAALGVCVLVGGGIWAWGELQQASQSRLLLPSLAMVGGGWMLLDARADFVQNRGIDAREDGRDALDEMDAGEAMLLMQHTRLVAEQLTEEPKTVGELATTCDLTESRVEEAIDLASRDGTVYRTDDDTADGRPRYSIDERKLGLSGFGRQAAGGLTGLFRRFVRPFGEQF
jgi:hypothetical protein